MPGDDVIRLANRGMVAFDLVLGAATIAAPDAALRAAGLANLAMSAGFAALARR